MKIILSEQEIMKSVEIYMALKGFATGKSFNFKLDRRKDEISVEIDVEHGKYKLETIKEYANK